MSDEKSMSEAREADRFGMRIKVLKDYIEENFYDPVFGEITNQYVKEQLYSLMKHFGL